NLAGFPGVVGVVDGTQIKIKAPSRNEQEYVGRKGGHTMNVQGIALADCSFSHVIANYPGAAHDSRILCESTLYAALLEGRKKGLLLGDSAYMLTPFIMKPLPAPTTDPELSYQEAFLTTRATVERAFGQLKQRWNCLHQKLRYRPEQCCTIIIACFCLHNFAIRRHLPPFPVEENRPIEGDNNDDVFDDVPDVAAALKGRVRQQQIIARYFS
uniref:DDE Tnp4 domain-containing protein n=1 Tax=Plectus sambesii TaxID=2011161 RepID=A0A914UYC8_9BILA